MHSQGYGKTNISQHTDDTAAAAAAAAAANIKRYCFPGISLVAHFSSLPCKDESTFENYRYRSM